MFAHFLLMPVKSCINNLSTIDWKKKKGKQTDNESMSKQRKRQTMGKEREKNALCFQFKALCISIRCAIQTLQSIRLHEATQKKCLVIVATSTIVKTFVQRTEIAQCTHSI